MADAVQIRLSNLVFSALPPPPRMRHLFSKLQTTLDIAAGVVNRLGEEEHLHHRHRHQPLRMRLSRWQESLMPPQYLHTIPRCAASSIRIQLYSRQTFQQLKRHGCMQHHGLKKGKTIARGDLFWSRDPIRIPRTTTMSFHQLRARGTPRRAEAAVRRMGGS
jgi:hypothetical protein